MSVATKKPEIENLKYFREALLTTDRILMPEYNGYNLEETLWDTIEYLRFCGKLPQDFPDFYDLDLSLFLETSYFLEAVHSAFDSDFDQDLKEILDGWRNLINEHNPKNAGWIEKGDTPCEEKYLSSLRDKRAFALGKNYVDIFVDLLDYVIESNKEA